LSDIEDNHNVTSVKKKQKKNLKRERETTCNIVVDQCHLNDFT